MRQGDCLEDERAPETADDVLERALARMTESLNRVGTGGGAAFTPDELILRAECAKRNRETILSGLRAQPASEP